MTDQKVGVDQGRGRAAASTTSSCRSATSSRRSPTTGSGLAEAVAPGFGISADEALEAGIALRRHRRRGLRPDAGPSRPLGCELRRRRRRRDGDVRARRRAPCRQVTRAGWRARLRGTGPGRASRSGGLIRATIVGPDDLRDRRSRSSTDPAIATTAMFGCHRVARVRGLRRAVRRRARAYLALGRRRLAAARRSARWSRDRPAGRCR